MPAFIPLIFLTTFIQGVAGIYDYHLVWTSSYNMIPTTEDYGLLDINGGTVYRSGVSSMSTTMGWMCRMLGYQSYYSYTYNRNYDWMQNYPVRYASLECAGSVVPQCRYQAANNYNIYNSLWLRCNNRNQLGDSTSFYLVDKDKQHTQKGHGILMYNGGTVSGNKFDATTAELVCRIMGYNNFMSWSTGRRYQFQDSLPIRLSDLNCLKSEEVFPFCVYGNNTSEETHEDDIWLWCALPTYNTFTMVCPPGQRRVSSNTCVQCKAGTYSPDPNESSSCLSCPVNSTSLAGSTSCSCKEGTYMNSAGDQCLTCPKKSTSQKGSTFCSCIAGTYLYSDFSNCVKCPVGTVSREGSKDPTNCISCPELTTSLNGGEACSCQNGYGWEWTSDKDGSCKACPANFYKDKDQGTCVQCPHEATSLPLSQDCQCPSGLSWDGSSCVDCASPNNTAGVCECLPGTFWSGESGQCEPCPQNHFSGKFSSVCKKCPLLTISEFQSVECTSCPKGFSWENYTCTECPDNHVGNGATCSVCPEGTTPSKDKTICQKSAVDGLSLTSLVFSLLVIAAVGGNAFFTWRERRARIVLENLQLTYQAEPSTMTSGTKVKGRRCMCPSCPCSEVPKPALPERGKAIQQDDVYANFN
ncbi:hypothetical protein ACHWQZ_G019152 [Mnemiopsis leidyi]